MKIILASNNKGKIREVRKVLGDGFEVYALSDVGFTDEIEEDGASFEENAFIKVHAVAEKFAEYVIIADDSGICANALGGEPGIYSARYCGEHGKDEENNKKLLDNLSDKADKSAYYACSIAVRLPNGDEFAVFGKCDGIVTEKAAGNGGFGYDPIFYLPEFGKTMAELTDDEKNSISHRGKALRLFADELKRRIK